MRKLTVSLFTVLFSLNAFAAGGDDFQTADEILYNAHDHTECATGVFADALHSASSEISADIDEESMQTVIHAVMSAPDVLTKVMECPEMQALADDETIRFMPIQYTFPNGREIVINYETQPQILKQRINIATKRNVGELNTPSPKIGDPNDSSLWTNTEPAWYGVMVVQHGAFDEFVGPDKNNTISVKYINDNIDKLYPRGKACTDKSALADDDKIINLAVHKTVGLGDDDKNDYYVAGDVNLHWITYTEVALDVVLTVSTMGGGKLLTGLTKAIRSSKTLKNITKTIKELRVVKEVQEYIIKASKLAKLEKRMGRIRDLQRIKQELSTIDKVTDAAKYADKAQDLERLQRELREVEKITNMTERQAKRLAELEKQEARLRAAQKNSKGAREAKDLRRQLTTLQQERNTIMKQVGVPNEAELTKMLESMEQEATTLSKEMATAAKEDANVAKYVQATKDYAEISDTVNKSAKTFRALKKAKAGNIITRLLDVAKQSKASNKALQKSARIARKSMASGKARDWLFQTTMRNIGALGRLQTNLGALYAVTKIVGNLYDWAETSTGKYTNGVDFKPLLLLSADDIKGQENEVNYGMWLMWAGDSTSPGDDDAAYLQSFDFANKFYMDLVETMDEKNNHACDVDIYVVRPVLRNPDTDNAEMYFLIMNDQPWSTAK